MEFLVGGGGKLKRHLGIIKTTEPIKNVEKV